MDENEYRALGLPLSGPALPPESLIQSVVVVAEIMLPDGNSTLWLQNTDPMTAWHELGVLRAAVLSVENDLRDYWVSDDD